jgi:hypothetical protein
MITRQDVYEVPRDLPDVDSKMVYIIANISSKPEMLQAKRIIQHAGTNLSQYRNSQRLLERLRWAVRIYLIHLDIYNNIACALNLEVEDHDFTTSEKVAIKLAVEQDQDIKNRLP